MQEYDKNMHKYAIVKYAQICTNMQKICKKYAQICNNMQGLGTLQNRQKYANYMHKYAQICIICNQGFHMQNMHEYALPTLLMSPNHLASTAVHIFHLIWCIFLKHVHICLYWCISWHMQYEQIWTRYVYVLICSYLWRWYKQKQLDTNRYKRI